MSDNNLNNKKKSHTPDWFVQGILSKIGDIFDKLTGRGWQGTSTLATSELSEKLKQILDSEVKDLGTKGKFVPHNIKLKMQWNKFSTDSDESMKKLEYELLTAAVDHINDRLYHTYKPLKIEVKPDYFTEGIKFFASFGEFDEEEREVEVNVTAPQLNVQNLIPQKVEEVPEGESVIADFTVGGKRKTVELKFAGGKRVGVGRTKENDLCIEDHSISKVHAALVLNSEGQLMVADTGSTNGTFINESRIAYGRAFVIGEGDKVKFGTVEVFLRRVPKKVDFATKEQYELEVPKTEAFELAPQPTIAASVPTEIYQSGNQDAKTFAPQIVHPPIPKSTEYNFEPVPKELPPVDPEDIPKELPVAQPTISAEDFVPQSVAGETDYEMNVTEHQVKLNFDDEEKK
jgi:pSer/pThr/pTyr-binding forkhead associated (FHA) protein